MARSDRPTPAVVDAWSALLVAHARLLPRLDHDLRASHDLPLDWYDVLHQLHEADGTLTMGRLGQRLLIGASSCTRRIDQMVAAGLVERSRDHNDARIIHAALTDKGLSLVRRAGVTHLLSIQEHFGRFLDDDQAATIARSLRAAASGSADRTGSGINPEVRGRPR